MSHPGRAGSVFVAVRISMSFTSRHPSPGFASSIKATVVKDNARNSVNQEPGCFLFDVLTPTAAVPSTVFLYEIYKDRAAFEYHCASPHFLSFDLATKHMVLQKTVLAYVVDEFRKA